MTITVLQENIFPKLQHALRFIASKPQLPILSGIYLSASNGELVIRSTDLKVGFQTTIGGKVEAEGECVVPGKYLEELCGSLHQGPLQLRSEGQSLHVSQGNVKAKLTSFPATDFPPFPKLGTQIVSLNRKTLLQAIEACSYAASLDESRPVIASMLLHLEGEQGTIAATDGYRLAVEDFATPAVEKEWSILIHAKMLMEVVRMLTKQTDEDVRFFVSEELSQVGFQVSDTSVLVRCTDGEFPKYSAIIPQTFALRVNVHREQLISALKTALVIAKESSSIISLHFAKQVVQVSGNSVNVGENQIDVETDYSGEEERTIACNARFLLDMLTRTSEEFVEFSMNEELKPLRLRPEKREDCTYIVMPYKK